MTSLRDISFVASGVYGASKACSGVKSGGAIKGGRLYDSGVTLARGKEGRFLAMVVEEKNKGRNVSATETLERLISDLLPKVD